MTIQISIGVIVFSILSCSSSVSAETGLHHVPILPISSERDDIFIGKGNTVEIRFINESGSSQVEVFPEPPMTITSTGKHCTIDGGVWVRNSVFLCPNEKVLMVQEFSGSNDFLNFYDTGTCTKIKEVDISGAKWRLTTSELVIERAAAKSASSIQKTPLKTLCRRDLSDE